MKEKEEEHIEIEANFETDIDDAVVQLLSQTKAQLQSIKEV